MRQLLKERRILLGVTGGIAAYKAAELARLLVKEGAEVQVVMTRSATEFIGPMTFQAITGRPARHNLFDEQHEAAMGHIELARWADFLLVAPATANFIAKLSYGLADDLLTTLCLATDAPIALAPAMNQQMWRNAATAENVSKLVSRGIRIWGPEEGDQACGDVGPGRLMEPQELLAKTQAQLAGGHLSGKRVMITAGPTREALDPVRFLGNRSSGKMGYALARAFRDEGADVTLVSGPVTLKTPGGLKRIDVETAAEMRQSVMDDIAGQDIFVACAAVADYRPAEISSGKIKKKKEDMLIRLLPNPDILAEVASLPDAPFCLGFAAETDNLNQYAESKRLAKGIQMIAANEVGAGQGFETEDNSLLVLWDGGQAKLPLQSKDSLAKSLVTLLIERFNKEKAEACTD